MPPPIADRPQLAVVECDGGRERTRLSNMGRGVHLTGNGWRETKNACLMRARTHTFQADPFPEPPACFLASEHVARLCEQAASPEQGEENTSDLPDPIDPELLKMKPRGVHRTALSSLCASEEFGVQMEAEARRRRFFEAALRVFLGDGLPWNWSIQREHFPDFTPVLDFTHALTYLFAAASVCFGKTANGWRAYRRWLRSVWQGGVDDVLDQLRHEQSRIGRPVAETR